ncbi:SAF domain-containing protein [Legionella pneumophila]|nr:SAF domain-containing protein [Legionella pneumophila]MCK0183387.1 SAF domain-containing protein [Legionella pneumophila]MCK1871824.1 SAF domain-containing protein [Legionella pneumophila]MCK1880936.1 SAF domain-containing protein [Legionella pneumophila]MCK1890333.1 SAF domain-containing protein [Legionella pneumophila]
MTQLVHESARAFDSLGKITYQPTESELASKRYRRSLYVTKDLKPGDSLTEDNIRAIRPGLGLSPKYLSSLIGKKAKKEIKRGTPLSWQLLD